MAKKDRLSIELEDKKLNAQIKQAIKHNPVETTRAAYGILLDLAGRSARMAPIESGDLRNDCTAELNKNTVFEQQKAAGGTPPPSLTAFGTVRYGLPYALKQHEDLSLSHDRTDGHRRPDGSTVNLVAGGEAKFLEKPFEQRKAVYEKRMEKLAEDLFA